PLTRLGLDSLAAMELKERVERQLGVEVSLGSLIEGIDIARLARNLLARLADEATAASVALEPGASLDGDLPLSCGQRALWFLDRLAPASGAYHISAAARVRPVPDATALRRALQDLALRHPALRATFREVDGEPRQRIDPRLAPELTIEDAEAMS